MIILFASLYLSMGFLLAAAELVGEEKIQRIDVIGLIMLWPLLLYTKVRMIGRRE